MSVTHPPSHPGLVMEFIAARYAQLSVGHRRVADFILSSPHEAALMTLKDLAQATNVSEATANRFSGRLGLSGHPELKRLLRQDLRGALNSIENFGDVVARARQSGDAWRMSLEDDAARILDVAPLDDWGGFARASLRLATARTIHILGFGSSAFLAQYTEFCLSALRPGCRALADSSGQEGLKRRLLDVGPEDVALVIAFARYSRASLEAAEVLGALGAPMISVTDGPDSPFASLSETSIIVPRKAGFVLSGAGGAALSAIDALLRGVADILGEDAVVRRSARLTSLLGESVIAP